MASGPGISRRRRLIFRVLLVAFLALFIEGSSCVAYRVVVGQSFSYARVAARARRASRLRVGDERQPANLDDRKYYPDEVIHPFLGFVDKPPSQCVCDKPQLIPKPKKGRIVVLILGGSVAFNFSHGEGLQRIKELIARSPALRGRDIKFAIGARYGYKQPQQLACVMYLSALGARVDVVINLDGFNEIATDKVSNEMDGAYPAFPTSWAVRVRNHKERGTITRLARVLDLRRERKELAAWFSSSALRASVTANTLWAAFDKRLAARVKQAEYALQRYKPPGGLGYVVKGPGRDDLTGERLDDFLADLWMRSSMLLHRLAESSGMLYLNFLQPSQYLPGAKPMLAAERSRAYRDGDPHRLAVLARYPKLLARGKQLRAMGVRYYSLAKVFAGMLEPIYVDTCCHMNGRGHRLMADVIGKKLVEALESYVRERPPRRSPASAPSTGERP